MPINKEIKSFGLPWERQYGYAQAVKVDDTIYLSGQVSHDDNGDIFGRGNMEAQMRQAYPNIRKLLEQYGAKMENLVGGIVCDRYEQGLRRCRQVQKRDLFRPSCCCKYNRADSASCLR
jgi:hypothetical protein